MTALPSDLLARAFQAAPNGFVLVDPHGQIVAANTELEAMFGAAPGSLIGQPVDRLLPDALRLAHRTQREAYARHPERRAMGAGRVLYAQRADGSHFPVEIGLNPMPGSGAPLVLASVVDVSERLALESAFRGLFDGSPVGLLIVNDAGDIVMANRVLAETLGHTPEALLGQPLAHLLPERYRGGHGARMAGYSGTGEARMMGSGRDLTALHRDGTEVPVEIGLSRVRWQRQTMTLAAVSDISARKRLELQLRQAHANLEEFTHVASHDLRSPLRGIADLVAWIEADLGEQPPAEVVKNLGRVGQRIQRMERLIDDLLSYARAGRAATEHSQIDLARTVQDVLDLQPLPAGFRLDLALNVPPFLATRVPLEAALRNLISNAVKHHDREQGVLRISAEADDNHCVIHVSDDGPGVPVAAQARIFKLFQTLSASPRGGSGIGLALTKRLVEVHGGQIALSSPLADGRGACFTVWWPRFPRRHANDPV